MPTKNRFAELQDEITAWRRDIHENPEILFETHRTSALVAEKLREFGCEEVVEGIGRTGVVGVLRGRGESDRAIGLRADMDALHLHEQNDFDHRSRTHGKMHACGHDVHVAVQMGVIAVLAQMRSEIPGTIKFIFQPAEEGPPPGEEGGAEVMLADGVFNNPKPEAVFGLHTYSELNVGKIGYTPGPAFAAVDHFIVKIRGQQAHGAAPHLSIDPVVMASRAVMALQTIRSRNQNPLQPSVITVGIIKGGERFNIIPAEVHLEGTVRTYDPATRDLIEKRMAEVL